MDESAELERGVIRTYRKYRKQYLSRLSDDVEDPEYVELMSKAITTGSYVPFLEGRPQYSAGLFWRVDRGDSGPVVKSSNFAELRGMFPKSSLLFVNERDVSFGMAEL